MIESIVDRHNLPRTSYDMYKKLGKKIKTNDLKIGDLLFFNTGRGISHVGLYWGKDTKGNHLMYHASSSHGVQIIAFQRSSYWRPRFVAAKRYQYISDALEIQDTQVLAKKHTKIHKVHWQSQLKAFCRELVRRSAKRF